MISPALAVSLAAGLIAPTAPVQDAASRPHVTRGVNIAQIHINPATGQRTVSPWGSDARGASKPLWLNNNTDPCATGGTVGVIDDPDTDGDGFADLFGGACVGGTLPCEGMWVNWWGDLHAPDSVIDRIVIRYATTVPDVDLNSDGVGDGVPGFDLCINFADNDYGFGASGRSCIIEICLEDLPGQVGQLPLGFSTVYEIVVDLANNAPSMVFELGDSDGIDDAGTGLSGGAIYGHPTFGDRDNDGRHNFSWSYRFDQSQIPQAQRGVAGFISAAPKLGNPGDLPVHPADAVGLVDDSDMYTSGPSCPPSETGYIGGPIGFFDFNCEPGGEAPFDASFIELYGRTASTGCSDTCDVADYVPPCGVRDFSDVLAFITFFSQEDPAADLAAPFGTLDFSDILVFLAAFENGCP